MLKKIKTIFILLTILSFEIKSANSSASSSNSSSSLRVNRKRKRAQNEDVNPSNMNSLNNVLADLRFPNELIDIIADYCGGEQEEYDKLLQELKLNIDDPIFLKGLLPKIKLLREGLLKCYPLDYKLTEDVINLEVEAILNSDKNEDGYEFVPLDIFQNRFTKSDFDLIKETDFINDKTRLDFLINLVEENFENKRYLNSFVECRVLRFCIYLIIKNSDDALLTLALKLRYILKNAEIFGIEKYIRHQMEFNAHSEKEELVKHYNLSF